MQRSRWKVGRYLEEDHRLLMALVPCEHWVGATALRVPEVLLGLEAVTIQRQLPLPAPQLERWLLLLLLACVCPRS